MDGERTMAASFHLLRGKRSGQTLQDVKYYGVKSFFGLLPKLPAGQFDKAVEVLRQDGLIAASPEAFISLSAKGREAAERLPDFHFSGMDYQGREMIFFGRLSLTVQTISHFRAGQSSFLPVQKDRHIQHHVRRLLAKTDIQDPAFARRLKDEVEQVLRRSGMDERQKEIFIHRLAGYRLSGWTWDQLGERFQLDPFDVHLSFIEGLHRILGVIESSSDLPLLHFMAENIKVTSYLTDSSRETKRMFDSGMRMEEIAAARRLKMSTIEDHLVEMAMNDPAFPLFQFVPEEAVDRVVGKAEELGTKRLRPLKMEFDSLTYFQLRLILGARTGRGSDGFAEST